MARVPYYFVPRSLSNLETKLAKSRLSPSSPSTTATVRNRGAVAGSADFYAWGLSDRRDSDGGDDDEDDDGGGNQAWRSNAHDLRAVGVQSFSFDTDWLLVFAMNTWERWSNAASNEFDVFIDTNGDGVDDFLVAGIDLAPLGLPGVLGSAVFSLPGEELVDAFIATAPTDSSTVLLPVAASALGLSEATPRFSYRAESFGFIAPDALGVRRGAILGVGHVDGGAAMRQRSGPSCRTRRPMPVSIVIAPRTSSR
jgi:hypothetical protein